MTHHSELLNLIAKKINAQAYLEIGVQNPNNNFNKIQVEDKVGVDPDPKAKATYESESDFYFETLNKQEEGNDKVFDLVFIDGLHHADQVKKDIQNAWNCLMPGGVIVVHDCNPDSERLTHVPRDNKIWNGNVYVTISQITSPYFFTVDFDEGCCVIRKGRDPLEFHEQEISWGTFDTGRRSLLNLKSVEESLKIIEAWI